MYRKNAWEHYEGTERARLEDFAEGYRAFLDSAKTEVEEKLAEIERLNMKIREQQLMLGSFEASWATRNAKAAGEEDGEQAGPVPRLAPLARDERRREASA